MLTNSDRKSSDRINTDYEGREELLKAIAKKYSNLKLCPSCCEHVRNPCQDVNEVFHCEHHQNS